MSFVHMYTWAITNFAVHRVVSTPAFSSSSKLLKLIKQLLHRLSMGGPV